jgi:hypothetical protein
MEKVIPEKNIVIGSLSKDKNGFWRVQVVATINTTYSSLPLYVQVDIESSITLDDEHIDKDVKCELLSQSLVKIFEVCK